jgi:small subunit ribosomal protein S21
MEIGSLLELWGGTEKVYYKNLLLTNLKLKTKSMIIVPVKDGENIERALKKFKRKFEKTGVVKELRARQQYDKPSVLKRLKMEHAVYVQKLRDAEE